MGLYQMTNVPVMDDDLTISIEISDGNVTLWQVKASEPSNRNHWWRIADINIGDHLFEPDKQKMLRKMYGQDVVFALNRGIQLGYAKAQSDIRKALGVQPLAARLRATLGGIAQEECCGDNLTILLASYFEPGIESEELDDCGTWKQGAIDACDKVLDAIHAHYTPLLESQAKALSEAEAVCNSYAEENQRLDNRALAAEARLAELDDDISGPPIDFIEVRPTNPTAGAS